MNHKKLAHMHYSAVRCAMNMQNTVDLLCKEVDLKQYGSAILSIKILQEQSGRLHKVCNDIRKGGE